MRSSSVATGGLLGIVIVLAGCYGGGGGSGTPLPAEVLHGALKGNRVAKRLVRQQAEEMSIGQPLLDRAGTLGAGRGAIDVRATLGQRQMPRVEDQPLAAGQPPEIPVNTQGVSGRVLTASAGFGLISGIPIGDNSRILGIDLVGGVSIGSDASTDALEVDTENRLLARHYGVRIGILKESPTLPGIAFSVVNSKGSARQFSWRESGGPEVGEVEMNGSTTVRMSGWSVTAGKHLGNLGFVAGAGRDTYKAEVGTTASVNAGSRGRADFTHGNIWNWFGSVSYRIGRVALVGEWRHQVNVEDPAFAPGSDAIGTTRRNQMTLGLALAP
jgi:hypothetical protein